MKSFILTLLLVSVVMGQSGIIILDTLPHHQKINVYPIDTALYSWSVAISKSYYGQSKWDWNTVKFTDSKDTMRIIIGNDTIYSEENYYVAVVKHIIHKEMFGEYDRLKRENEELKAKYNNTLQSLRYWRKRYSELEKGIK